MVGSEEKWDQAKKNAQKEIFAAAREASAKTGVSELDLIWEAYLTNPYDPEYHAPVAAHQLELSRNQQLQLLSMLGMDASRPRLPSEKGDDPADFLPLVRLHLGAPDYNRDALIVLSYARPDEARDIAVKDLASPQPSYLNGAGGSGRLAVTLLENPHIKWTEAQKRILDTMRR